MTLGKSSVNAVVEWLVVVYRSVGLMPLRCDVAKGDDWPVDIVMPGSVTVVSFTITEFETNDMPRETRQLKRPKESLSTSVSARQGALSLLRLGLR